MQGDPPAITRTRSESDSTSSIFPTAELRAGLWSECQGYTYFCQLFRSLHSVAAHLGQRTAAEAATEVRP